MAFITSGRYCSKYTLKGKTICRLRSDDTVRVSFAVFTLGSAPQREGQGPPPSPCLWLNLGQHRGVPLRLHVIELKLPSFPCSLRCLPASAPAKTATAHLRLEGGENARGVRPWDEGKAIIRVAAHLRIFTKAANEERYANHGA